MGVAIRSADRPEDLGWMVWQHGEVYAATLGWDTSFEALVARIVADFATADPDPRLAGWIAELDGRRVGCVLCVPGSERHVAVLRILLVTPDARGHGAGRSLVEACVDHATRTGCTELTLWTNDVLVSRGGSTRRPASSSSTPTRTTRSGRTWSASTGGWRSPWLTRP